MRVLFKTLKPAEKMATVFLAVVALFAAFRVGQAFYEAHTEALPMPGGAYTEGGTGKLELINPLFAQPGSVTYDVTRLVFSGLTRYDPATGTVTGDLADFTVSPDGRQYAFVIKKDAKWHDGQPVTADDVLFTYNGVLLQPDFKGIVKSIYDFSGLRVVKVDDRTVQFLLEKPDAFFLVKTLVGLLPQHLLSGIAPGEMDQAPYNLAPVGAGRYRFVSATPVGDHVEVSLEAFESYPGATPHIPAVVLKVYPENKALFKDLGELDGVRNVPEEYLKKVENNRRFSLVPYHLPQYVAVFLNTESPVLKNNKVRLALQLGTNKAALAQAIGQEQIIDTPLLEIDQENWANQYSVAKANGALFETEWQIPDKEKVMAETAPLIIPSGEDTSAVLAITAPNGGKDFETAETKITLEGTAPRGTQAVLVNDYALRKFLPGQTTWTYVASAEFENLRPGTNVFKVYAEDAKGVRTLVDAITVTVKTPQEKQVESDSKRLEENQAAGELPTRLNRTGEPLKLRMVTSLMPEAYPRVAGILKEQWRKIGVELAVEVLEGEAFSRAIAARDYDLLLFGQNLGYNLDAYPYWHSSQAKSGLNLSQFKNFVADSLLEQARLQQNEESRVKTLKEIQKVFSAEVPAIFLYSPTYHFAHSSKVSNASFEHLATASDRLGSMSDWYARYDRQWKEGVTPFSFLAWITKQF